MTPEQAAKAAATFVDYWRAKPGAAGRSLDSPATWRVWVRRDVERLGQRGQPRNHDHQPPPRSLSRHFLDMTKNGPDPLSSPIPASETDKQTALAFLALLPRQRTDLDDETTALLAAAYMFSLEGVLRDGLLAAVRDVMRGGLGTLSCRALQSCAWPSTGPARACTRRSTSAAAIAGDDDEPLVRPPGYLQPWERERHERARLNALIEAENRRARRGARRPRRQQVIRLPDLRSFRRR